MTPTRNAGANFQSISVAQGINASASPTSGKNELGGYVDAAHPNGLVLEAMHFLDNLVGRILATLNATGLLDTTAIILAGKHGQSPIKAATLNRIDPNRFNEVRPLFRRSRGSGRRQQEQRRWWQQQWQAAPAAAAAGQPPAPLDPPEPRKP